MKMFEKRVRYMCQIKKMFCSTIVVTLVCLGRMQCTPKTKKQHNSKSIHIFILIEKKSLL